MGRVKKAPAWGRLLYIRVWNARGIEAVHSWKGWHSIRASKRFAHHRGLWEEVPLVACMWWGYPKSETLQDTQEEHYLECIPEHLNLCLGSFENRKWSNRLKDLRQNNSTCILQWSNFIYCVVCFISILPFSKKRIWDSLQIQWCPTRRC